MFISKQIHYWFLLFCVTAFIAVSAVIARAQTPGRLSAERVYPKEIRGYKVERVAIEKKHSETHDGILKFGQASVIDLAPLGVTLELPIVVSPVKQKGKVDFLTFYDVTVNGTSVEVADYTDSFELPTESALTLQRPLKVYVAMPRALIGAVLEWASPQPTWSCDGRRVRLRPIQERDLYIQTRGACRNRSSDAQPVPERGRAKRTKATMKKGSTWASLWRFIDRAALHHETHAPECRNIVRGIALDRD